MLSYKYYLNTLTRTISKHTATVMLYKYYLNTVTLTVNKHTVAVLRVINITLTQSHIPSHYVAIQPVFVICVIKHIKMAGEFLQLPPLGIV